MITKEGLWAAFKFVLSVLLAGVVVWTLVVLMFSI